MAEELIIKCLECFLKNIDFIDNNKILDNKKFCLLNYSKLL